MDHIKRGKGAPTPRAFRVSCAVVPIFAVMFMLAAVATLQLQSVNHPPAAYAGSSGPIAGTGY